MDAGGADGGEEVSVVRPAGDDVDVEMAGNAGAGGSAEVEPDIETVRLHGLAKGVGHPVDEGPEIGGLLGGEGGEVVHLAVGADHEVAEVVGKTVEDGKGGLGAGEDEVSGVVGLNLLVLDQSPTKPVLGGLAAEPSGRGAGGRWKNHKPVS